MIVDGKAIAEDLYKELQARRAKLARAAFGFATGRPRIARFSPANILWREHASRAHSQM